MRRRRPAPNAAVLSCILPSRILILLLCGVGCALAALGIGAFPPMLTLSVALAVAALLSAALGVDVALSITRWRASPLLLQRQLPRAFALGAAVTVTVSIENPSRFRRRGQFFEMGDSTLDMSGMPLAFDVGPGRRESLQFKITPLARGAKRFEPGQIRLRSSLGLLDWTLRIGAEESRRVFPNFERQTTVEWLTGKRRLAEIGIKSVRRRGSATDFDQLVDYRAGDAIRHIDWKSTLKHQRPIVRKYQDDRDQSVMFLLDCGRRMRADDTQHGIGATHFDQALNALMLLAFIALSKGDAVGALTFGTSESMQKAFAPRKGRQSLNALMAELSDVEPTTTFSDYGRAAADAIVRHRKRGLLVLITNCREEDSGELAAALKLLRSRHLVVLANLREQIIGQIAAQPVADDAAALEVAAALEYEQRRRDMLRRLGLGGVVMIDCEPQQLGVQLANRYIALKSAGSI
jgi:uncharacterized protein (DUF58 family)